MREREVSEGGREGDVGEGGEGGRDYNKGGRNIRREVREGGR